MPVKNGYARLVVNCQCSQGSGSPLLFFRECKERDYCIIHMFFMNEDVCSQTNQRTYIIYFLSTGPISSIVQHNFDVDRRLVLRSRGRDDIEFYRGKSGASHALRGRRLRAEPRGRGEVFEYDRRHGGRTRLFRRTSASRVAADGRRNGRKRRESLRQSEEKERTNPGKLYADR